MFPEALFDGKGDMNLRGIWRTIVLDSVTNKLRLVRHEGGNFWYAPGGGWEYESESVQECASREAIEETGIAVEVIRLLYVQEFRPNKTDVHIELFWLAHPASNTEIGDIDDQFGTVEEARWFSKEELQSLTVYPVELKERFWNEISESTTPPPDPFLTEER